jgi:hypothetical protein
MLRPAIVAICAALSYSSGAFACASSVPDLGSEIYCGKYRGGPKTSFYKVNGQIADFEQYDTITELLQTLPKDTQMRDGRYQWGLATAPTRRVTEERHNVEITTGYIVAVKPNEDDHDFHVIVSDRQSGAGRRFMNVEVSGLPRNGANNDEFVRVREEIRSILPPGSDQGTNYIILDKPVTVTIRGSVFFDGDHQAGCGTCPGPAAAKPKTVWEIHPVYSIQRAQ